MLYVTVDVRSAAILLLLLLHSIAVLNLYVISNTAYKAIITEPIGYAETTCTSANRILVHMPRYR